MAEFVRAVRAFHDALSAVEVGALPPSACAALVAELAQVRKACEAVEVALAARAASTGAHRRAGYAAAADWLAAVSGTTAHAARVALETVAEVEACPETRDALFEGRVSMEQAREIAFTEQVAPGNEARLVELASGAGLRRVREVARDLRVAAITPEELHACQHAARSFVHWRDELGMVCVRGRFTPEVGLTLVKRVETEARRIRRATKSVEPFEALAADAFCGLLKGTVGTGEGRADLVLVCDIAAWLRRHGHEGEVTKIVGGGPLPVSVIEALSANAFFKVVLHDGVQVQTVAHYGRSIPAHVRTALELGLPPAFDGPRCSDPNCDREHDLQADHTDPHSNGGVTNASNLALKCTPDHKEKTRRDRAAGRLGVGHRDRRGYAPNMNLVGHVAVALVADDPLPSTEFLVGCMLPDLAAIARVRLARPQGALGRGVAFHHACDAVFHDLAWFHDANLHLRDALLDAGVGRGAARACSHAGTEMLLDGALVEDARVRVAARRTLDAVTSDATELALLAPVDAQTSAAQRFRRIGTSLDPIRYQDRQFVAERLQAMTSGRRRIELPAEHVDTVAAVLESVRPHIAAASPAVLRDVRDSLAASTHLVQ